MASSAERAHEKRGPADPETLVFADDGVFPNSRLPVLIYRGALRTPDAAAFERLFEANGWSSAWRNGLYSVHHYHSTAHEVLGLYGGRVNARLGRRARPVGHAGGGRRHRHPRRRGAQERRRQRRFPRRRRVSAGNVARHAVRQAGRAPGHRSQHRARRPPRGRSGARGRRRARALVEGEVMVLGAARPTRSRWAARARNGARARSSPAACRARTRATRGCARSRRTACRTRSRWD